MLGELALEEALIILVVEDDQSIQSIVEEALSDGGFKPTIASSGEEALTLLGGSKYRVLVIDIKLGKDRIRGWDVARRARAINPGLPVVYITGANADEWAVQGVPNSVLLTKPFAPAQLVTAVSNLLNTGSPIA
jgi:DNA-binding response OmpR family regulator